MSDSRDDGEPTLRQLSSQGDGGVSDVILELDPATRYEDIGLLGEGGMGEVRACHDRVVGRTIARKVIRTTSAGSGTPQTESRAQFLREARVQGQLEHPSVAPVYDVGRDPSGEIFFTMKRVVGMTLHEVLELLRDGDEIGEKRFGRHRLLTAFQMLCECVEYAHSRGVVHRDLKPSNVMFGDFGEVYVLDWGVALVDDAPGHVRVGIPSSESGTSGTPGYMAPEQLGGEVDRRTDVYALGAILFELLTLERLHDGEDAEALIASTKRGADARASVRAPQRDVPPELEALCVRATAARPEDRPPTVRVLGEEIERFLEGNRDLELRREIAARHVAEARRLAEIALSGDDPRHEARSRALSEIGRALALRPDARDAASVLATLLSTPPRRLPPEALVALDAERNEQGRSASWLAGWIFAAMVVIGFVMWRVGGAREVWPVLLFLGASALASIVAFANVKKATDAGGIAIITLAGIAIAATTAVLGPLVMTPILAIALALISTNIGRLSRYRLFFVVFACAIFAVPALLEWRHALPTSYVNDAGRWCIVSKVAEVPAERAYPLGLLFASVVATVASSLFAWRLADRTARLRMEVQLHAWHLRQLVPEEARSSAVTSIAPPP